jgi:hypothetical protein
MRYFGGANARQAHVEKTIVFRPPVCLSRFYEKIAWAGRVGWSGVESCRFRDAHFDASF